MTLKESIRESINETVETLTVQEQKEVLDFAEFLKTKKESKRKKKPLKSLKGLWKGANITREDIDEARREMWSNFPREEGW